MSDQIKRLNIADEKFSKKKLLGFSLVRLGNILSGLMLGEITYFATNSLGIAAAAISIGLAIKTAIDAVTDLLMGAIVDRTHTKYGKARPWVLAGIPMWITTILIFMSPRAAMSDMGLVIYITILSTFSSAVFGTMCNIAYETHIKRSIVNNENRVKTLTVIGMIYAIGSMGLQIALPILINIFRGSQKGFIILAVITGVIGIVACLLAFMLCEEYSEEELAAFEGYEPEKQKEHVPISLFLKSILKNRYLIQFTLINFMYMIILMSSFTVGQYYFQYIYGSLSTFSIVMAASVALFPVFAFIPKLAKKFGSAQLLSGSMILAAGGVILRVIIPKSIVAQMIGYLLVSLPNIINACVLSQINYEIMEYGRYKSGIVAEGMYSAFVSFAQKMATSLNSVIIGVILTGTGFDFLTKAVKENGFADWGELAALGEAGFEKYVTGGAEAVNRALSGINFAYNWLPLIFLVLSVILLFSFHLERDLKALRVENGFNEDGTLAKKED